MPFLGLVRMSEVSISVAIGESTYQVKVGASDEVFVKEAAQVVNDKMNMLRETYVVTDRRDLLAMCALQLALEKVQLSPKLEGIDQLLNSCLD